MRGSARPVRAVLWITEATWQASVDQVGVLLPGDAQLTLLHVSPTDAEEVVSAAPAGLLGRRPRWPPGPPLRAVSAREAEALLGAARARLGRAAEIAARRGKVEREVLAACADADLLVLCRDGRPHPGPGSLGPRARFVVDHAPCQVLLLWAPSGGANQ